MVSPLRAVTALAELCRTRRKSGELEIVKAFDWRPYPRIAEVLEGRSSTRFAIQPVATRMLAEALIEAKKYVREQAGTFVDEKGRRRFEAMIEATDHYFLRNGSWTKFGHRVAITRTDWYDYREELFAWILEWAAETEEPVDVLPVVHGDPPEESRIEESLEEVGVEPAATGEPGFVSNTRSRRVFYWIVLGVSLVAILAIAAAVARRNSSFPELRPGDIGITIEIPSANERLKLPTQNRYFDLPDEPAGVLEALILPSGNVLVGTRATATSHGDIVLWDPKHRKKLRRYSFEPQPHKIEGASNPDDNVLKDAPWFTTCELYYGSASANLGGSFAAVFRHRERANFVVMFDLETGEVLRDYVAPGHLTQGIVADFVNDSRPEILLSGNDASADQSGEFCQDPKRGRPMVVLLDPLDFGSGAASSVRDGDRMYKEGAIARVVLPDECALQGSMGLPFFYALDPKQTPHGFLVYLGAGSERAITAKVDLSAQQVAVVVETWQRKHWVKAGMDPTLAKRRELEERVDWVEQGQ